MRNTPTLKFSDQPTTSDDSLLSVDAQTLTETLAQEFEMAQNLATAWRSDAEPVAVTVTWPPNLARGRAKRVYVFGSPTETATWWTVAMHEQTGERVRSLIPKEDYLGPNVAPIARKYWQVNAVQALQIADGEGGKQFRQEHPGAQVSASLITQGPKGWLWWIVSYRGEDNQTLQVRIDPATGDVYNENGDLVRPLEPTPTASAS